MKFKLILLLLIGLVYGYFFTNGPKVANDFHYLYRETGLSLVNLPHSFRDVVTAEGLGEYSVSTLWSWPINFIYGLLTHLNLNFSLVTLLLGVLPIILLGVWGMNKLLDQLKVLSWVKCIGIFFFLCNTYIILLVDGGQMNIALSYSALPLAFAFFNNSLIGFLLSVIAISFLDPRIIFFLIILIVINYIYDISSNRKHILSFTKRYLFTGLLTGIFFLGLHAYWLTPAIFLKAPSLPEGYQRIQQIDFLSFASLGHALFLQTPHWYENVFGRVSNLRAEFVFIPLLVFLAPILRRKDKVVGFWLLVALTGIFLTKGSQPPLSGAYPWLFIHIPGFSLFRDPTKFYFLTALAYSVLLAVSVEEISKLKFRYPAVNEQVLCFANKLIKVTPILVLIYLIWLVRPVYLGQMTGMFSKPIYEKEYFKLAEILEKSKGFSRVFWIPTKAPLGFSSPTHPSVEASRMVQKRPFATGVKGTYETFNFLREAPFTGELFDVAGIGYIAYPFLDPRRDDMHPDSVRYYYTFLKQLSKLPWVLGADKDSPIPLLKIREHQDRFFITQNLWWIVGSDDIYQEATKSANLKLAKNSLVFTEEYSGLGRKLEEFPEGKIVLNKKGLIDLAASFIKSEDVIFPASQLDFHPDKSGWWKRETSDLIWWRDFLQTKYGLDNQDFDFGGGWAVAEGSLKLKVQSEKLKRGDILLARVFESTRSGQLKFHQGDKLIGKINTLKTGNHVRWFEVGILPADKPITIESRGDINIVNALAFIKPQEWQVYKNKADDFYKQGRIVDYKYVNILEDATEVRHQKINPTKYKAIIANLDRPGFLVFSESFDSLWRMGNQDSIPVYSLLNGFRVEKDGEYIVEFEAQKYVYPGLVISGITLLVLIIILIPPSLKRFWH